MMRFFPYIIFSIFFPLVAVAQKTDTLTNGIQVTCQDTIYFKGSFPILEIDSCLQQLLEDVVEADSNASYFSEGRENIIYTIDFRNHDTYIDMFLWPMRISRSNSFDYVGILDIKGTYFLCTGDYQNGNLFKKSTKPGINIVLKRPKIHGTLDKIDKSISELLHNISMFGTYIECPGLKIVTSIYIQNKLPGYELEKRKNISGN